MYGSGAQRGPIIGCANIEPSNVPEEQIIVISFPRNGTIPDVIDRYLSTSIIIYMLCIASIYVVSWHACVAIYRY